MCYYWALIKCIFLLNGVVDADTFVVCCGNAVSSMCLTKCAASYNYVDSELPVFRHGSTSLIYAPGR